ncbi:Lrp/AsnC family transcriptional regulator [Candidatus Nitrosocosmicus agrestis]|jgi:DNA-binding Lrp family transcriptional regulator|nr:Lrp/AsnC family transcriptional regulator [Candidatus Nitrosocosmicus sp. SS]KAA2282779.1 Lrp/AsnC family transcriptional regulator [Candidatus Nitrosocosmicus sp. SS]KAF0870287.1 Lrp/AsnC family transcriptional regulator [Candidatus Nitrosocosmicus sp. SS]
MKNLSIEMIKNDGYCLVTELINQNVNNPLDRFINVDETDIEIISHLLLGKNNKNISSEMNIPLSTVQRRVRNLISKELVLFSSDINYNKFGFKVGMLHIYQKDGNIERIAEEIKVMPGVRSVEIHIGNSDLIANVVYKDGTDLLKLISKVKSKTGVERIVWSERIQKILSPNIFSIEHF